MKFGAADVASIRLFALKPLRIGEVITTTVLISGALQGNVV
jgi:hypothetical protein